MTAEPHSMSECLKAGDSMWKPIPVIREGDDYIVIEIRNGDKYHSRQAVDEWRVYCPSNLEKMIGITLERKYNKTLERCQRYCDKLNSLDRETHHDENDIKRFYETKLRGKP